MYKYLRFFSLTVVPSLVIQCWFRNFPQTLHEWFMAILVTILGIILIAVVWKPEVDSK